MLQLEDYKPSLDTMPLNRMPGRQAPQKRNPNLQDQANNISIAYFLKLKLKKCLVQYVDSDTQLLINYYLLIILTLIDLLLPWLKQESWGIG